MKHIMLEFHGEFNVDEQKVFRSGIRLPKKFKKIKSITHEIRLSLSDTDIRRFFLTCFRLHLAKADK